MFKFNIGDTVYFKSRHFVNADPCECCGDVKQKVEERISAGVIVEQYLTVKESGKILSYLIKDSFGTDHHRSHREEELISEEEINQNPNIWRSV